MTIHRTRPFYSVNGATSFNGWLGVWVTNMTPWTSEEVTNEVPDGPTETVDGDNQYYQVELAFEWTEDKAIILDQLDEFLASYCDWHRFGYHVCTHDEENRQPCSWDEKRENGTVPDYIPSI